MKTTLSHTFTFQIQSALVESGRNENIIFINEEDATKHFVQYIQYRENSDKSIDLRHISIKLDRSYYLEIANSCIDNRERRRYFFATLGKRRFGASNKHLDAYFSNKELNEKDLFPSYLNHYENTEFTPCYTEKTKYSTNQFRVFIEQYNDIHIVFLDQLHTSSRKKIHKIFCVDIESDDLKLYNTIQHPQQRINYIFNKIGKVYFKNLDETHISKTKNKTTEELALSMLIKTSDAMEKSSRINDNSTFRKLQESRIEAGRVDTILHTAATELITDPSSKSSEDFTLALRAFIAHLEGINGLKNISEHLKSVEELSAAKTILYLLTKEDQDVKDIFLYILEAFGLWNQHLYAETENIKSFNIASIDLEDALRYFVDICYKFKHEHKCADVKLDEVQTIEPEEEVVQEEEIELCEDTHTTSAQSYFADIDLDSEVYDELLELERDIEVLGYASNYTEDINQGLISFFEGYTRVLNPLFEFKDLSYSLMLLAQKLSEYEIDENSEMLLILMRGLITDLLEWKRTVLIEQTAEDIHFMDKSFYSNIAQIEMSLAPHQVDSSTDDEEWDMEFF